MKSDDIKKGITRAPHRSLLRALGLGDRELGLPFIGVANSFNEIIPGHLHLRSVTEAVKQGIWAAGGVPFEFGGIGVCDGLAMNHEGMRFSLASPSQTPMPPNSKGTPPAAQIPCLTASVTLRRWRWPGICLLYTSDAADE